MRASKWAHALTAPFDVIAFAEVPNLFALSDLVLTKIQSVKGVEKTQTAVVVAPDVLDKVFRKSDAVKISARHRSK